MLIQDDHRATELLTPAATTCPGCGSANSELFYSVDSIPINSCILMRSRDAALTYPRGDMRLTLCQACGFVWNAAFNPRLIQYSDEYEETQAFSDTFNKFHAALADTLIRRYSLEHKTILEIGCGKGEFLALLCERGKNRGIGFDPGYRDSRNKSSARERMEFITDFYSEKYSSYLGDLVCCKMTLEHIDRVNDFVGMVRRAIADRKDTIVFFQIPEMGVILRECRFWDVYYEHCSYFTPGSLSRLFQNCNFDVLNVSTAYDDQYLLIESRPTDAEGRFLNAPEVAPEAPEDVGRWVVIFKKEIDRRRDYWGEYLHSARKSGKRVAIWGSGSKAVSFLTTLGLGEEISAVVDINPYRQGKFMPGTGHEIIAPSALQKNRPDIVIIMNAIYRDEIELMLNGMGLHPELAAV